MIGLYVLTAGAAANRRGLAGPGDGPRPDWSGVPAAEKQGGRVGRRDDRVAQPSSCDWENGTFPVVISATGGMVKSIAASRSASYRLPAMVAGRQDASSRRVVRAGQAFFPFARSFPVQAIMAV